VVVRIGIDERRMDGAEERGDFSSSVSSEGD